MSVNCFRLIVRANERGWTISKQIFDKPTPARYTPPPDLGASIPGGP